MLTEFELIDRYFLRRHGTRSPFASLGVGDDCALLPGRGDQSYAVSTDMLVSGRHFLPDVDPYRLGHKALAVNLSDLAAMGASPRAFTLSLALPTADAAWLSAFSAGLFALADAHECELVGGDTTAGPLTISITVFGELPAAQALRRDAGRPGDDVYVSGTLGDARLALALFREEYRTPKRSDNPDAAAGHEAQAAPFDWQCDRWTRSPAALLETVRGRMELPTPRVALGVALRGVAHAAIDLSDGLFGDLSHIVRRSRVSAKINADAIPRSAALSELPTAAQYLCTIAGGDDYELCFTAPVHARERIQQIGTTLGVPLTRIGTLEAVPANTAVAVEGATLDLSPSVSHTAAQTAPERNGGARILWTCADGQPLGPAMTRGLKGFDHFQDAET